MVDKKFFKPVAIERWVVVVYERQGRFNDQAAQDMISQCLFASVLTWISFYQEGLCGSCCDIGAFTAFVTALLSFSLHLFPLRD
jgi:hypothetical protein